MTEASDARVEAIRELANRNDLGVFIGQVAVREFVAAYDEQRARAERAEETQARLVEACEHAATCNSNMLARLEREVAGGILLETTLRRLHGHSLNLLEAHVAIDEGAAIEPHLWNLFQSAVEYAGAVIATAAAPDEEGDDHE